MKALILAAGRGSRMRHLTDDRPKGLVEFAGKPLIARQVDSLRAAGVDEIGIVTGYMAQATAPYGTTSFHNPRWAQTQMLTSLAAADAWLTAGPILVSYSDIFYTPRTVTALAASDAALAIAYDPDAVALWSDRMEDPLSDLETFRRDASGNLAEIGERAQTLAEIEGQYMGLLRFTPESWAATQGLRAALDPATRDALHMTGLLQRLIADGARVACVPCAGPWGEIDSVEDLAFFQADVPRFLPGA